LSFLGVQADRTAAMAQTTSTSFTGFSNHAGRPKNGAVSNTEDAKPRPLTAKVRLST
jgi:hypothetical protein